MEVLRSYVVRVYRHDSHGLAGVLESVETGDVTPFRSSEELWAQLTQSLATRKFESSNLNDQQGNK